uniref:Uncharacterized protein n=1 Tax=Panagrolaimus sp. ES5 TaxID=591445 RepID=A0AC34GAQ7_9BILA
MKHFIVVVAVCLILYVQTSNQQPFNSRILEREILDKIGKHGTVINIFEATNDQTRNAKNDEDADSSNDGTVKYQRIKRKS